MDMTTPVPYSQAVPRLDTNAMAAQLANLQVNNNNKNNTNTQPTNINGGTLPAQPTQNNSTTGAHPRTGIPRYCIPYRRPPQRTSSEADHDLHPPSISSNGHHDEVFDENLVSPISAASAPTPPQPPSSVSGTDYPPISSVGCNSTRSNFSRTRYDRAASEDFFRCDSGSENSSGFSASRQPMRITSKVGSFANVRHKAGGGNVKIFDEKLNFNVPQGKCNSKANIHHKPGGGDVAILDTKLNFTETSKSKIGSLQNKKHHPGGGNVKIDSQKLEFKKTAKPKVASLDNARYNPGGGEVQIFNEKLPWLKYNKPNLPEEERIRINKQQTSPHMSTSGHSSNLS